MRYSLFVRSEDDDFAIKERTLYLPLMSDLAIDALMADQLVFYKALDRVMPVPFDMVLAWHNTFLVEYKPYRLYHPRYIARYFVSPKTACRWLRCEPASLMEYFLWADARKFNEGYFTENEIENICRYKEVMEAYVQDLSCLPKQEGGE